MRDEAIYDVLLHPLNGVLVDELAPTPREPNLDVGCGFGSTALLVAERGAAVHGVDISGPMIERVRERAAAANQPVTFAVADAETDPLGGPYDTVMSRLGVRCAAVGTELELGGARGVEGAVHQSLTSSVAKSLLALGDESLRERAAVMLREQFEALAVDGSVRRPAALWLVTARR